GIYYVSQKYYRIEYEYRKIGFIFISLFISTAAYFTVQINTDIHWYVKFIFLALFVLLIFLFRVINPQSLQNLRKS
ncbi:MAG: hypothetical protein JNJ56_11845, partial [Ignavibacteria bacterium]|nr:hypothetical protein [Ignavibacteria bacterium]